MIIHKVFSWLHYWKQKYFSILDLNMADFERIEIDPTTSEARFERSDFAQVIFHNILETYTTEANIDCAYTITPNLVPTPKDWIGLFRYECV